MASDRKSDRKIKRDSSPIDKDRGKNKKKRTGEDGERSKGSSSRRDKIEHSKSRIRSDSGKKSKEKHRSKSSKHGRHLNLNLPEITKDDYFSKNNEFAMWLKEERKKFFSDLTSESSRELFSEFVKEWNKKKLDMKYYEGIASAPRTSHNWKIK